MRIPATYAALLALGVSAFAAPPPVIKKAADFIIAEPSGKQTPLSSYKGKVVVVEFLYTTCPHCQAESQMLTKLYREMGPRGLQVAGVAFNDNASILVPEFVRKTGAPYPIGVATQTTILNYLGFSIVDRYVVPQVMVIDRNGNVRAQSPVGGDVNLQTEEYMRNLIDTLLKEPAGAAPATTKAPAKTSASVH
jgi:peroxiredoxin